MLHSIPSDTESQDSQVCRGVVFRLLKIMQLVTNLYYDVQEFIVKCLWIFHCHAHSHIQFLVIKQLYQSQTSHLQICNIPNCIKDIVFAIYLQLFFLLSPRFDTTLLIFSFPYCQVFVYIMVNVFLFDVIQPPINVTCQTSKNMER